MDFTVLAFIGILLLIGIVKKNGIMLIDFALQAERERGLSVHDSALEAARERFRPILMTTLAALFGAFASRLRAASARKCADLWASLLLAGCCSARYSRFIRRP